MTGPLRPACLDWSQGDPRAAYFGDVYFSSAGGLAETCHVFLDGNALAARFCAARTESNKLLKSYNYKEYLKQNITHNPPAGIAPGFTLVETGFGTGLNWLAAMTLWAGSAPTTAPAGPAWLHVVSVEKHPFTLTDLTRAHQRLLAGWPTAGAAPARPPSALPRLATPAAHAQASAVASALQARWPALVPGFHRLVFPEWQATLTLFFGDVADFLPRLVARADAWCLDGFAPGRNPAMWTPALYAGMAARSHAGTTLATFTAAGHVRRGLAAAGFTVRKAPGFGRKREMLAGVFAPAGADSTRGAAADAASRPTPLPHEEANVAAGAASAAMTTTETAPTIPLPDIRPTPPWLARPPLPAARRNARRAVVIGAGIAGAATAARLALRGWVVTVLDAGDGPGAPDWTAASGNPAAILYPKLAPAALADDHFQQQAYLFTLRELAALPAASSLWQPCGVLQLLAGNQAREGDKLAGHPWDGLLARACTPEDASRIAGIALPCAAQFYPGAGWLDAAGFCRQLLAAPGIRLQVQSPVSRLAQDEDGHWQALAANGQPLASAPVLVLAGGLGMRALPETDGLPLRPVRGQISRLAPSPASAALRTVLCYGGYLSPVLPGGEHCLGATFQPGREDIDERTEDHHENRAGLRQLLPALADSLPVTDTWQGRAALRCQSPDYLPMVGPLADAAVMAEDYAGLADGRVQDYPPLAVRSGLYANLAHGSKGFTNALLSAEVLAAELCGEPAPVSQACLEALHPMRFVIRALRRRKAQR